MSHKTGVWVGSIAAVLAQCLVAVTAQAQEYPVRPVKMMVGYGAGGAVDVAARLVADSWQGRFSQPVVVENRPGASGMVAAEFTSKAPADGYTVMMTSGGTMTIVVHLVKPGFDSLRDFAPISTFVFNDAVIVVNPKNPARTLQELIAEAKRNPGKLSFGSSGLGGPQHLAGELLKVRAGIDMVHIPYKGDAQGTTDLLGGNLNIMMAAIPSVAGQIRAGAVRAVAMLADRRNADFPDIPTVAESGFPGYSVVNWVAPIAPAGTPPAIIQKLNEATRAVLADPAAVKKLAAMGSRVEASTPDEFGKLIRSEYAKWGDVIRTQNIKLE